jgi:hypothetical protein
VVESSTIPVVDFSFSHQPTSQSAKGVNSKSNMTIHDTQAPCGNLSAQVLIMRFHILFNTVVNYTKFGTASVALSYSGVPSPVDRDSISSA